MLLVPYPMFGVLQPFSSRSCIVVSLKNDAIEEHDFSPISCFANESRYFSCSYHLERIVGWLPCFSCLAVLSISFALKNMICRSGWPCFGPGVEFFIMTNPRIEVQSLFAFWVVGLREYFEFPATSINDSDCGKGIAIRTLLFFRIPAKFEDLCLVHVGE